VPRRAAAAAVMLLVAGAAVGQGGPVLRGFIALVAVACYAEYLLLIRRATKRSGARLAAALGGALYIGLAAWGLASFQAYHIVGVLGVVIFTDTCAYFAGRAIGGPKIAPRISPSKTWAGLAGGMVGSALWLEAYVSLAHNADGAVRWADNFGLGMAEALGWAVVGALLAIAAQAGDFFESWLKRKAAVKDSSRLIPGHGGVFDRVDGMLPVAIIVWLFAVLG
jgi:phosphatidate cytidylyltransferase